MNILDAFKIYSALDAEQKSLLALKKIAGDHTPARWLALLGNVAMYDRRADELRKTVGWSIGISFLLIVIGGAITPWLIIPFALLFIGSIILFFVLRGKDLPNNLRLFVLPFLAILREEMETESPLHLELDLTGGMNKTKLLRSQDVPGRARARESFYRDPWMRGSGELADGSSLEWSITDDIRERTITKTNPRGKTKTKTKYKVRRLIEVRVGLRNDEYALAGSATPTGDDRVAVKEGEKRNVLKLRRILTHSDPKSVLELNDVVDLLAGAYRRVQLTHAEER